MADKIAKYFPNQNWEICALILETVYKIKPNNTKTCNQKSNNQRDLLKLAKKNKVSYTGEHHMFIYVSHETLQARRECKSIIKLLNENQTSFTLITQI